MSGTDADDWFAEFEREARAAAERREREAGGTPAAPPAAGEPAAPPPLVAPPAPVPPVLPPVTPVLPTAAPATPPASTPPAAPNPSAVADASAPTPDLPPTQAMPAPAWEPAPTQALSASDLAASLAGDTPPPSAEVVPFGSAGSTDDAPASALDALFAEDRFREYDAGPDPSENPFAARSRSTELVAVDGIVPPRPPRRPIPPAVLWAGGGVLAVLALGLLFLIGTRLPDLLGPAPAIVAPTASPSPTITALPIGPVPPGEYRWNELLGGECLEEFTDAWQDSYVVVDCADDHPAQLVLRAWFPPAVPDPANPVVGKPTDPFPGVEALEAQITLLCQAPGVVNLTAAGAYLDVVTSASYPLTEEAWDEDPSYYCFVSRSSGEPLTGSLAIPRTPTPGG